MICIATFCLLLFQTLTNKTMINDINGRPTEALNVFAACLSHLRGRLLEAIKIQTGAVIETDILYVITVPAIWDDKAKQFMREAAVKVSIESVLIVSMTKIP